ncbi:MAG: YitT family protein [Bacteroidetes bacterium]|jgi:uncharacterized membrane-anchored protein YitT (DUF2179 family)|nr:YitT family protein [Bacteroidota bacterium]
MFDYIIDKIFPFRRDSNGNRKGRSRYVVAHDYFRFRIAIRQALMSFIFIALGVLSAGFGLRGFLLPNKFIDGGVTGISLLVSLKTAIDVSILIVVINIPFLILAYRQIDFKFFIKSIIAIICLALAVHYIPYPTVTNDKLLVSIFGGFFLGMGIGFAIRGGSVLDGTEVLAIYIGRKSGLSIGEIIFAFNIIIFSFAALLTTIEVALYSVLIYMAASRTVDFIVEGVEEYTGVTIISSHSEEIRRLITEKLNMGVTIYSGKRGYGKNGHNLSEIEILYTVITRLEVNKLKVEIEHIDPHAFIIMNTVRDTKGGMIKKRTVKDFK